MKLFRLIAIFVMSITAIIFIVIKLYLEPISPKSNQNDFYDKLNNAFQTSNLTPINLTVRDYLNEVEFYLQNENGQSTKVIFSTKKDPYWQIVSLQDFSKTAKINNRQIYLVDLSIDHPYATFKNN